MCQLAHRQGHSKAQVPQLAQGLVAVAGLQLLALGAVSVVPEACWPQLLVHQQGRCQAQSCWAGQGLPAVGSGQAEGGLGAAEPAGAWSWRLLPQRHTAGYGQRGAGVGSGWWPLEARSWLGWQVAQAAWDLAQMAMGTCSQIFEFEFQFLACSFTLRAGGGWGGEEGGGHCPAWPCMQP